MGESITVNGAEGQETHSYAQKKHRFAEGSYTDGVNMGESITVNGAEGQEKHSYMQLSRNGVDGTDAIGEANDLESFGNNQTVAANTRVPYASTLVQTRRNGEDGTDSIGEANDLESFGHN